MIGKPLVRLLLILAISAYLAAGIYLGEILIRLPRKPLPENASAVAQSLAAEAHATWEPAAIRAADGLTMRGWWLHAQPQTSGAVVLLHGQTANRLDMAGYAKLFLRHGYDVLVPDLRAHGNSQGQFTTYGVAEAEDLRRWVGWLEEHHAPAPLYALGESMGGAILLQALPAERRFCAVIAEGPYASFRESAYDRVSNRYAVGPWPGRYPLRPIVELAFLYDRLRYDIDLDAASPEDAVARAQTPILLIYGTGDVNAPPRHSIRIWQHNPNRITRWEIPGAGHTGAWAASPAEFERRLLDWFRPLACAH